MKRNGIAALLLILAVIVGLLLPQVFAMPQSEQDVKRYEINSVRLDSMITVGQKLVRGRAGSTIEIDSGRTRTRRQATQEAADFVRTLLPEQSPQEITSQPMLVFLPEGSSFIVWHCQFQLPDSMTWVQVALDDATGAVLALDIEADVLAETVGGENMYLAVQELFERFLDALKDNLPEQRVTWSNPYLSLDSVAGESISADVIFGESVITVTDGEESYELPLYVDEMSFLFNS